MSAKLQNYNFEGSRNRTVPEVNLVQICAVKCPEFENCPLGVPIIMRTQSKSWVNVHESVDRIYEVEHGSGIGACFDGEASHMTRDMREFESIFHTCESGRQAT